MITLSNVRRDKAADLRDADVLYDEATSHFERGFHRKAFVLFDLCVIVRPRDARFRLSRAICAFSLDVHYQTIEDARQAFIMKRDERSSEEFREVQSRLSEALRASILQADHRHMARCQFWMGKAWFELGETSQALKHFHDSKQYLNTAKTLQMITACTDLVRLGMAELRQQTARWRTKSLFCDEDWFERDDGYVQQGATSRSNSSTSNSNSSNSGASFLYLCGSPPSVGQDATPRPRFVDLLQHPRDSLLPESVTGAQGIFYREVYEAHRAGLFRRALERQRAVASSASEGMTMCI